MWVRWPFDLLVCWRNHFFFSKKNVTTIILILGATYFRNCDCVRETFSGLSSYGGSEILICLCLFCPFSYNIYQFHSLFYNHSWWLDEINVSWGTSNRYEESLVPWSDASQTFFLGKSIFGDVAEIIEEVAYFFLLKDIKQNKLLLGRCNKQMFVVQLNISNRAIIRVDLIVSNVGSSDIDHSNLSFSSNYDIILNEMHTHYFLTVDIKSKELFFVFNAHTDNISFDITKS